MVPRALLLATVMLACTACANERAPQVMGYQALSQPARPNTMQTAPITGGQQTAPAVLPKKNMADKVLTAIALERVTGRKPDPSRLVEVN